jgi:hypothetical protein
MIEESAGNACHSRSESGNGIDGAEGDLLDNPLHLPRSYRRHRLWDGEEAIRDTRLNTGSALVYNSFFTFLAFVCRQRTLCNILLSRASVDHGRDPRIQVFSGA